MRIHIFRANATFASFTLLLVVRVLIHYDFTQFFFCNYAVEILSRWMSVFRLFPMADVFALFSWTREWLLHLQELLIYRKLAASHVVLFRFFFFRTVDLSLLLSGVAREEYGFFRHPRLLQMLLWVPETTTQGKELMRIPEICRTSRSNLDKIRQSQQSLMFPFNFMKAGTIFIGFDGLT